MKSHIYIITLSLAGCMILNSPGHAQVDYQKTQTEKTPLPDSVFFKSLVTEYAQSIDQADTLLALKIWAPTSEISFINPRGTEYGWEGIKNIYTMFRENFTARKLSFYNIKYAYYGNVSWLTFYWIFNATLKTDNTAVQTRGRETQIWKKINYEWRLVHVHYSAMPVTGQGQGF
jgi:hypothetical protein